MTDKPVAPDEAQRLRELHKTALAAARGRQRAVAALGGTTREKRAARLAAERLTLYEGMLPQ